MEHETLATELLREYKNMALRSSENERKNAKHWFIAFLVVLFMWFATIGIFVWYINQPIEQTETITYSQDADTQGDSSPISQNIEE